MKQYKNIYIVPGSTDVCFGDTDADTINWLVEEVKKTSPNCSVSLSDPDVMGEPTSASIRDLDGRDRKISWWIFRLLLENGWEPYATTTEGKSYYFLRKSIDV